MRRSAGTAAGLLLLGAAAYVALRGSADPRDLFRLPLGLLLLALGLRCAAYLFSAGAVHVLIRSHAPGLSFAEYLRVASRGTTLAYVASSVSGIGYKAAYFKYKHGVSLLRYVGVNALTSLMTIVAGSIVGLVGLATVHARGVQVPGLCWAAAGTGLAVGMLPLALVASGGPRRIPALHRLDQALRRATLEPRALSTAFLLCLSRSLASGAALGVVFLAYRPDAMAFVSGVVSDGLTAAARVFMLTPRNLGVNEWLLGVVGRAAGMPLHAALAASMVHLMLAIVSTLLVFAVSHLLPGRKEFR